MIDYHTYGVEIHYSTKSLAFARADYAVKAVSLEAAEGAARRVFGNDKRRKTARITRVHTFLIHKAA